MSYQALYRKYRPSTLEDVIGQDTIVKIIKNSVINNKIGHAYLFSGPRGIGKTSIAKLFAKTVNCLEPVDGMPCGKCKNCVSINSEYNSDIIEIDAASNNGVDEIREIRNKINLVPNQLKYKVYIIDEVHMLSIGAFNALLKTLEEPPEYIIFILATTDPQKVPATIVSRCQCFEFHRISDNDIVKRLEYICKNEKITVEPEVLDSISVLADGGLRDAIGLLDKVNSYSNGNITLSDFEMINGIVSLAEKQKFLKLVENGQIIEIIEFIDKIYDLGKDMIIFAQDLLNITKNCIIDYYVSNKCDYDIDFLLKMADFLNKLTGSIKNATDVKTLLEISTISFINQNVALKTETVKKIENKNISQEIIDVVSEQMTDTSTAEATISVEKDYFDENYNQKVVNNCFARANKKNKQLFEEKWPKLSEYVLDNNFGAIAGFLSDAKIEVVGEKEILLSFEYESMVSRGINMLDDIINLIKKIYDTSYDVAILTTAECNQKKKKYVDDKNNGISYEYIEVTRKKDKINKDNTGTNSIVEEAIGLFGNDVISIN